MSPDRPAPHPLGPETEHYWLVQRMAKATGVDLVAAWDEGRLTQQEWADIVTHCRGCQWTEGCARWLDILHEDERALPRKCVNHDRLAALRPKDTPGGEPET